MKTNLYYGCLTSAEVQLRYDELNKIFNNEDEMLQAIKNEYSTLMSVLSETIPVVEEKEKVLVSDMIKVLQEKVNPEGLRLEVVGKWLWLSGATFAVKESLKELGFKYSPDKRSWYWRNEEDKSSNEKPISLVMIREKFGSHQIALQ
jgi:hypothetical protein